MKSNFKAEATVTTITFKGLSKRFSPSEYKAIQVVDPQVSKNLSKNYFQKLLFSTKQIECSQTKMKPDYTEVVI